MTLVSDAGFMNSGITGSHPDATGAVNGHVDDPLQANFPMGRFWSARVWPARC